MRLFTLWALVALVVQSVYAQKSPVKFGDIPLEDLKMKIYDKDSSASAVILSDYGEAYVSLTSINASLMFERHVRIKILSKDGMEWGDVAIPVYHSGSKEERVTKIKATTYNLENGKIVETNLSKDGMLKEKFNRNVNFLKFTFPNVKEGSVLEYSYTISSEFLSNFPNWQFQYDIPVRWSEYWAMFPEFFSFEKYMQGYLTLTSYEVKNKAEANFQVMAHHWIMKDSPAFKEEPFMTCEDDYVAKMNIALSHITIPGEPTTEIMGTWVKLNANLQESEAFGRAISGYGSLRKKSEELTAGLTDTQQKVEAIFNYVRQNIEWNGNKDFYADDLKDIMEKKKGTAGDINILLASMLEKIDIPVDMVLLSTRDHGFVREQYPMEDQFNYVVASVKIGDKRILLDATDKYLPMGVLPERCLNGHGLVISKTNHGWLSLETKVKSKTIVTTDFTLKETGELAGKINYTFDGYDAHNVRRDYFAKGEEDYLKKFLADKNWEIQKSEFQNLKEVEKNAKQLHDLVINEHCILTGNAIYLNPYVTSQLKENPFKQEKRQYPVDFGSPEEQTYMSKIVIPDGYIVDELPKPKVFVLPGSAAKFSYNVTQTGNVVNIISMVQINKSLFLQDEYPHLREFYNMIVAKQAEQIVLKKK
ncbi:MAG TPA: DUF3857 domain-containing protein [Ohtaekwangia sp.]|uniref:transglutaminase domain-containing protein n=1 Tax=Ohtaekwangia sp. TaxID=2066019 RepID=UPI002F95F493